MATVLCCTHCTVSSHMAVRGIFWKHKSDLCHTVAHTQRGSQWPSCGLQGPEQPGCGWPLPHPLPLSLSLCPLYHIGCHLILPGTDCAWHLWFLLPGMLFPRTSPWLLSPSSGLCSQRPSLTSDEKPPLPCTASLFFLALFTTEMASVSICLSLRGWKPSEGRDIICLVYPIPAKQKPAVLYWIEEEMGGERGREGKEFRNCLVLKYIRKYTKEKGTSLSLLFFWVFLSISIVCFFLYFYLDFSELLGNKEELLNLIS